MRVTSKTKFPILAEQFRNMNELANLMRCSERTARRSVSGNRPFKEYELRDIENYLGLPREYFLRRANSL